MNALGARLVLKVFGNNLRISASDNPFNQLQTLSFNTWKRLTGLWVFQFWPLTQTLQL